jgi:hypothetical protein
MVLTSRSRLRYDLFQSSPDLNRGRQSGRTMKKVKPTSEKQVAWAISPAVLGTDVIGACLAWYGLTNTNRVELTAAPVSYLEARPYQMLGRSKSISTTCRLQSNDCLQ